MFGGLAFVKDDARSNLIARSDGLIASLTDLTVHSLDIALPCGIDPAINDETVTAVLDTLVQPRR